MPARAYAYVHRILVFIGSGGPMIEIESDQRYPLRARRHQRPVSSIRRAVVILVLIGPQQETVAGQDDAADGRLEVRRRDRRATDPVADVGDDRITEVGTQRDVLQVGRAFNHVRGCVDMRAGMQAHMGAADDLAVAAVFVLFDDFDVELHVFLEAAIRAHVEGAGIQRQADVDELSGRQVQVHEILALLSGGNRNVRGFQEEKFDVCRGSFRSFWRCANQIRS